MERAPATMAHNLPVNINTQEKELVSPNFRQTNHRDIKEFTNHMCNAFKYLKRISDQLHAEFCHFLQTMDMLSYFMLIPVVPDVGCLQFRNFPVRFL
jgi:hypothetical protein